MEKLVEDEYHLLITCSLYKVLCEKYGDTLFNEHDGVYHIQIQISTNKGDDILYALFSHREFLLWSSNPAS